MRKKSRDENIIDKTLESFRKETIKKHGKKFAEGFEAATECSYAMLKEILPAVKSESYRKGMIAGIVVCSSILAVFYLGTFIINNF